MAGPQKFEKSYPNETKLAIAHCYSCKSVLTKHDAIARNIVKTDTALFHKTHFCCAYCEKNLSGKGYAEFNKKITCTDCYQEKENPKCSECGGTIDGIAAQLFDSAKFYHKDCVKCCACRNPLADGKFMTLVDSVGNKQAVDQDCFFTAKYKLNKDA